MKQPIPNKMKKQEEQEERYLTYSITDLTEEEFKLVWLWFKNEKLINEYLERIGVKPKEL